MDQIWPLEHGNNVCKPCEEKLPKKIKKEKIVNLEKVDLILIEKDFKKIMNHLDKKDIINVMGNKIIAEELFIKLSIRFWGWKTI